LEKIIKDLIATLDKPYQSQYPHDQYKSQFLPQLKPESPVIINGNPIGGKIAFQDHWLKFPLTQHSITSIDFHPIPGTGTLILNISGKLRFDESGKTRTGETAEVPVSGQPPSQPGSLQSSSLTSRNLWSSWLGFNANLIADETIINNNGNAECINSLNWKVVYSPEDVLVSL
jgi:mRNA transport regulator MTR2